jgi:uncharacterized protein YjbI with pentapeptide repeats
MANKHHLGMLKESPEAWNDWRRKEEERSLAFAVPILANLSEDELLRAKLLSVKIQRVDLSKANLIGINLSGINLSGADLSMADLVGVNLSGADLTVANLSTANLFGANLTGANLYEARFIGTDLRRANLSGADFMGAHFGGTAFSQTNLSNSRGLEASSHTGPSPIDFPTLQLSGPLPLAFLRGVGLPDMLIDYLPSLLNQSIQLYSCFISYSAKDEDFVRRLYADLQDKGVRCWFAPEDMKIGAKILDTLDEAIRLRDKVLLVLSEASIASDWVEDEVTKAFAEERRRGMTVLFPVRLDDAVFAAKEAWALKLRDNRNIGDFRHWKDHDAYQRTLERLLRDLRVETGSA